jgi:hypothetical protein
LNPVHPIALDISTTIASVILCGQDSTLFFSVETRLLKAHSHQPDPAWCPRWRQQAPAVRNLTWARHRLFGLVLTAVSQWNCENGNPISSFDTSHSSDMLSLKCSREHVITASGDGFVKVWPIADRSLVTVLEQKKCNSIEIEVDDPSLFISSSEKILRRYDLKSLHLAGKMRLSERGMSMRSWQSFLILADYSTVSVLGISALKVDQPSAFPQLIQCNNRARKIPKPMPPQARLRGLTDHGFYDASFALNVHRVNLTRPAGVPRVYRSAVRPGRSWRRSRVDDRVRGIRLRRVVCKQRIRVLRSTASSRSWNSSGRLRRRHPAHGIQMGECCPFWSRSSRTLESSIP